ncbi:MAG: cysteine--tRNA ligase [Betaproteobacteria bacterium]|nr:cysteine--tRNA ligase [Rhodocyclaceae bacterium]
MLQIFDSLARDKRVLVPIEPGHVRLYVCGMTVYDDCHLGHARVLVVFDMVVRWLRTSGYRVTYVRNVTDIDDKIIRRAGENGESIRALTDRYIARMHEDATALGVLPPDHEPRATDYVADMQSLIEQLEHNGLAYVAGNRDVCFHVRAFPGYGRLSGKTLDDLRAGERVEPAEGKRDPLDFVLWKQAKPEEPEEAQWPSRWGRGRPGWHIECSAMSTRLLGPSFDIHGGGADLQFPHHENEIAQSEGALGKPFVNIWMHNGFVRVDNEKMSKSLGNFFTVRDILARYQPEVVRFFILRAHYRSPLNYSDQHLDDARSALTRLYTALQHTAPSPTDPDWKVGAAARFVSAMNDDFNTPEAIAVLFDLATEANRSRSAETAGLLKALAATLGLLQSDPDRFLKAAPSQPEGVGLSDAEIEARIAARLAAKKDRDFALADRLRAELSASGIVLEDRAGGITDWRRA